MVSTNFVGQESYLSIIKAQMMKHHFLFFALMLCFVLVQGQQQALEVLSAGGGAVRTDILHIDWTLGEAAVASYADDNRMFTEGFHQPVIRVERVMPAPDRESDVQAASPDASLQVFPNPTSGDLTVRLSSPAEEDARFILLAPAGEIVGQFRMPAGHTDGQLNIAALPSGIYFLKMVQTGQEDPAIFRITKTN